MIFTLKNKILILSTCLFQVSVAMQYLQLTDKSSKRGLSQDYTPAKRARIAQMMNNVASELMTESYSNESSPKSPEYDIFGTQPVLPLKKLVAGASRPKLPAIQEMYKVLKPSLVSFSHEQTKQQLIPRKGAITQIHLLSGARGNAVLISNNHLLVGDLVVNNWVKQDDNVSCFSRDRLSLAYGLANRVYCYIDSYPKFLGRHPDNITAILNFASNYERGIISGSADGAIKIWNERTPGAKIFLGHAGPVQALCMMDKGILVSGSADKAIKFWDKSKCINTINLPSAVECLASHGAFLIAGLSDGSMYFWERVAHVGKIMPLQCKEKISHIYLMPFAGTENLIVIFSTLQKIGVKGIQLKHGEYFAFGSINAPSGEEIVSLHIQMPKFKSAKQVQFMITFGTNNGYVRQGLVTIKKKSDIKASQFFNSTGKYNLGQKK